MKQVGMVQVCYSCSIFDSALGLDLRVWRAVALVPVLSWNLPRSKVYRAVRLTIYGLVDRPCGH